MNVTDMMNGIHGNEVYTAAYLMNQETVEQIEATYQEAWDSGRGFTATTMFSPRTDDEIEMKICANQMLASLKNLVKKEWLARYTRDEITVLCGMLLKGPQKRYTRVRLIADLEMTINDIALEWNDANPKESPIYLPDPDIG